MDITQLFPEIEAIKDDELKQACLLLSTRVVTLREQMEQIQAAVIALKEKIILKLGNN